MTDATDAARQANGQLRGGVGGGGVQFYWTRRKVRDTSTSETFLQAKKAVRKTRSVRSDSVWSVYGPSKIPLKDFLSVSSRSETDGPARLTPSRT